jgi:hypothetical protein
MSNEYTQVEKRIVRRLVRELKKAGFAVDSVWDGGEYVKTSTEESVLDAVFSVGLSTIHFDAGKGANGKSHGVAIVCGNGYDCLSDWHVSDADFDAAVQRVTDWINTQEAA